MPEDQNPSQRSASARSTGNEAIVSAAFRAALHGEPIQDLGTVHEVSRYTSPNNWVTLARAALVHAHEIPASDFDPLVAQTATEFGSQLYDFSWSLCTYATIPTQPAIDAYSAMLAATALCLCPAEKIELQDLSGNHRRDRDYGMAHYRGPISMLPGNRMIWTPGQAMVFAERNIAGPLAAWALGQDWSWDGWDHDTLGWAMEAAYPRQGPLGHQHGHKVDLSSNPESLVPFIDKLKMRSNQRLDLLLLPGGGLFGLLSQSTFNTRGPALVTEYVPDQKLMRLISPAQEHGNGEWTACKASLEADGSWAVWQDGNPAQRIEGQVAKPDLHIVWDAAGCRIEGQTQSPLPETIPELQDAGVLYDSVLNQLGAQGYPDSKDREARGRTAYEVMNRIASTKRSSAREAAEILLADMRANGW